MHDIFNLLFTSFSLIQNYLSRTGIISPVTHYKTMFAYTFIDTFSLPGNVRQYSIFIHHIAVMHLTYGAIIHREINCHDVCLLEITTLLNSLNRLYLNEFTRLSRNISWIIVRLVLFPCITFDIMRQMHELGVASGDDMAVFRTYSFSLLTLLILSLEWTNEILRCDNKWISSCYFTIPLFMHVCSANYTGVLYTFSLTVLSISKLPTICLRYENRLLINLISSIYVARNPSLAWNS